MANSPCRCTPQEQRSSGLTAPLRRQGLLVSLEHRTAGADADILQCSCSFILHPQPGGDPLSTKKKEKKGAGPSMPIRCWHRLCQTLLRNFRPDVPRETQLCLLWARKRPGGCSFLGHHRKLFACSREQKHVLSLLGQAIVICTQDSARDCGQKGKKAEQGLSAQFSSQLLAEKYLQMAGGVIFPWMPLRRVALHGMPGGCKRVSRLTWSCKARLPQWLLPQHPAGKSLPSSSISCFRPALEVHACRWTGTVWRWPEAQLAGVKVSSYPQR